MFSVTVDKFIQHSVDLGARLEASSRWWVRRQCRTTFMILLLAEIRLDNIWQHYTLDRREGEAR